jgi:hypothetical protein
MFWNWIRRRLTFANVVAVLALFLALGTGAVLAGRHPTTGKIVGYAKVKANGDVARTKSLHVRNSNVSHPDPGYYCFRNLSFRFKGAQVTIDYAGALDGGDSEQAEFAGRNAFGVCNGSRVKGLVATSDGTTLANEPFFIEFYK